MALWSYRLLKSSDLGGFRTSSGDFQRVSAGFGGGICSKDRVFWFFVLTGGCGVRAFRFDGPCAAETPVRGGEFFDEAESVLNVRGVQPLPRFGWSEIMWTPVWAAGPVVGW